MLFKAIHLLCSGNLLKPVKDLLPSYFKITSLLQAIKCKKLINLLKFFKIIHNLFQTYLNQNIKLLKFLILISKTVFVKEKYRK